MPESTKSMLDNRAAIIKRKIEILAELEKIKREEAEKMALLMPLKAKENYATYVEYTHQFDKDFHMAKFQRYICDCIDDLLNGKLLNPKGEPYVGICLSQPPQSGKSRCVTETLPSYFLGRNPYKNVIEVSYSDTFANRFGRRNLEKIYQFGKQLFGIEISSDKSAAEEFEIKGSRGGMLSAGLGGAITGNPADLCFPAGTMIATEIGDVPIEKIKVGMLVWGRGRKPVLEPVVAIKSSIAEALTTIKTRSGRIIKSTPDHRIWIDRWGYQKACDVMAGDVLECMEDIDCVEEVSQESIECEVYDIQVEETHNFFANGILVHNCIIDDPYKTMIEADSPSHKALVMDVWTSAIKMRVSATCKFVVVHTRWNEDDLIGYLLATEPDRWFEINLKMEAEEDEEISGRKIGDPLLPEAGKDKKWVEEQKRSFLLDPLGGGVRVWEAAYQGNPSNREGNMIKREYWQRYKLSLAMQRGEGLQEMLQSWDCSFKDTKNSDLVAGGVFGRNGADIFWLDVDYGRKDIIATINAILKMTKKWPKALRKLIEDKANGSAVITMLKRKLPGMIAVQATVSKEERVNAVLPVWEAGNVFIPSEIEVKPGIWKKCEWSDVVIDQCAAFKPGKKVQKDDLVDCATQGISRLMYSFNFKEAKVDIEGFFLESELEDKKFKPYEIKKIKEKMKRSWEV